MLPYGLHSAPKIFNNLADTLEWCFRCQGVEHILHYLNNYIVVGLPDGPICSGAMATLLVSCSYFGVPVGQHKLDGPATCLIFLGIEVDTMAGELRLPADKLHRLQTLLRQWGDHKACQCRELESLVGLLTHTCKSGQGWLLTPPQND